MIEASGRDLLIGDQESAVEGEMEGQKHEDILEFIVDIQDDPDMVHPAAAKHFRGADRLLMKPFDFYSFEVELNREE